MPWLNVFKSEMSIRTIEDYLLDDVSNYKNILVVLIRVIFQFSVILLSFLWKDTRISILNS